MSMAVIGGDGFVGSAFLRELIRLGYDPVNVNRTSFDLLEKQQWDLVVDAAGNSLKYLAESDPDSDFDRTVAHKMRVMSRFPASMHIHVSSVDVYSELSNPQATSESGSLGCGSSHYGFHKWISEELASHHLDSWLIVRLAGMVGPGLRKNPVHDILHERPIRIHPDSQYQFMATDDVARISIGLWKSGRNRDVINICGKGTISPAEIARMANKKIHLSEEATLSRPRIVDINIQKLSAIMPVPETSITVQGFLNKQHP
jgi:nucleoside-diphosphate-sugar epimerase